MKIRGLYFLILLLAACASPTAVSTPTPTPIEISIEPTATLIPTEEPTATSQPTIEPTATEIMPTVTATIEPTATAVPVNTFASARDIQSALILHAETPVIEREPSNRYLNGGAIIFHEGQFHAFSNFFNSWPGETVTYYYTSADGNAWERAIEEPLFTIDDVPLDGRGALALSGLVMPDGTWTLYYHTFTSGGQQGAIGRATAPAPTGPWTFDEDPVLSPGSEGAWDELQVMRVNVLPTDDGFVMYYAGVNRQSESRIGMATSADGILWEKYDDPTTTEGLYAESDPILEAALDWEGKWLGRPEVVQTADGWVMLYEGGRGSQTGLAISQDGKSFARYEANPILTKQNMVEGYSFFQGAFFHEADRYYYLIEAGNGRIGTDIFLYTIDGSLLEASTSDNQETAVSYQFAQPHAEPAIPRNISKSTRSDPGAVLYHEGQFHMFINRFDRFPGRVEIGYATSIDGQNWVEQTDTPLLTTEDVPFAEVAVVASDVMVEADGTWVLYFHTWQTFSLANGEGVIGRATASSPQGPWTVHPEPVLMMASSSEEWDGGQVSIADVGLVDGEYRMYYTGASLSGLMQVGLATSTDGLMWTKYDDPSTTDAPYAESDPVVANGQSGAWDANAAFTARVTTTSDGWLMLYKNIGTSSSGPLMGAALSTDGFVWEKVETPLFDSAIVENGRSFGLTALAEHNNTLYLFTEHFTDSQSQTDIYLVTAVAP